MKTLKKISKTIICVAANLILCTSLYGQVDNSKFTKVAENDCGVKSAQPFLIKGGDFALPKTIKGSKKAVTANFGGSVIYAFNGVDITADYTMDVTFLADSDRIIQIYADGSPVCENITLPKGKEIHKTIALPRKAFAYGQLVLIMEAVKGPNAIISNLDIYSTNASKLTPFVGDAKAALEGAVSYVVDTNVDVESVLPTYTPRPKGVSGVYKPHMTLNGVWEFAEKEGGEFHPIQVPGQWSMQGFKVDSAGWGVYKKLFTTPKDWKGKQTMLRFDGVHSEYEIFINGKKAGYHLGGMTAYEMKVSD